MKTIISKVSEEVQYFPGEGGVPLFPGGGFKSLFLLKPIELVICQGVSGPPIPSLDPHVINDKKVYYGCANKKHAHLIII